MYESAWELLHSRDDDIQNDKSILHLLSTTTLSTSEAWNKIVHIRNGSIRYAACHSFLGKEVGKNEVQQTGDTRVVFLMEDATISLPGQSAATQQITVSLNDLPNLVDHPTKSETMCSAEKSVEKYLSLLKSNGSVPELVRARMPEESKYWSDFGCRMYYYFVLHPCDVIQDRDTILYWESVLDEEKEKRKSRDRKNWEDWNAQRRIVQYFKEEIYPKLLAFELPVFIRINQRVYPAEKFFSLAGV